MKKIIIALVGLIILASLLILLLRPSMHKFVKIDENYYVQSSDTATKEVEWNNWHSNLVNKLIIESKTAPDNQPLGTINYIEFDVDNNQNIVNIKIYSEPEKYSNVAKNHFSQVVRSLDGDRVLKFPNESQRKLVKFKAVLKKSEKTELSSPQDFLDVETVKFKR